jgi:hypothetical protein
MIISRKRFEKEVRERVEQELHRFYEHRDREDREREHIRQIRELENRLIKVEKACGIDHPSHNTLEAVRACY